MKRRFTALLHSHKRFREFLCEDDDHEASGTASVDDYWDEWASKGVPIDKNEESTIVGIPLFDAAAGI